MQSYENTVKSRLSSLPFIQSVIYHESVDSTNIVAGELAQKGRNAWTVVIADTQGSGRGRQGRTWFSPPQRNIYTSFILKPGMSYEYFPAVSLLSGMVVAMAIEQFIRIPAELKWPNDVLIQGKKISGILLETGSDNHERPYIVTGIGINVNADIEEYPAPLDGSSVSMKSLAKTLFDRAEVLYALYTLFYEWYTIYCDNRGFDGIREQFMKRFTMIHRPVRIVNGTEQISGIVEDIDGYGRLVIRNAHDGTTIVKSGDVHMIS